MIEKTKKLRVQIDGLSQLVKGLQNIKMCANPDCKDCELETSYEVDKSYDSLVLAKGWLGKLLFELGDVSPYKSGYKTKDDIEPTADTSSFPYSGFDLLSHIEKVDFLRTEIEEVIVIVKDWHIAMPSPNVATRETAICRTNSYNHLCEAKMWLGSELKRIKEGK